MYVCLFHTNLRDYFVLLLVEPIAEKNASLSDKLLWQFLKNIFVSEKWSSNALSIGCYLEFFFAFADISIKHMMAYFLSLKLCFLGFV